MADIFEEVDESLRQDRFRAIFRRYAPYGAAALLVIIAIVGGREFYVAQSAARAASGADAYSEASDLVAEGQLGPGRTQFAALAETGSGGYRAVAKIREAATALDIEAGAEAAALFEEAAELTDDPLLRDLALLKAAYARADELAFPALEARLTPMTDNDRPFALAARELLAAAALKAGELDRAQEAYRFISLAANASDEQRARAEQALSLLQARAWTTPEEPDE
ncbi:MAG: tetratricopeptide repeat protein [Caulobacterales bacterium]|nr:tetratricopeptide repeat protein [Caulobacterales bacterium]